MTIRMVGIFGSFDHYFICDFCRCEFEVHNINDTEEVYQDEGIEGKSITIKCKCPECGHHIMKTVKAMYSHIY